MLPSHPTPTPAPPAEDLPLRAAEHGDHLHGGLPRQRQDGDRCHGRGAAAGDFFWLEPFLAPREAVGRVPFRFDGPVFDQDLNPEVSFPCLP